MTHSRRYAGYQVQPKKTVALLKSRQWTVSYEEGLQKVFYAESLIASLQAMADWFSPADTEAPTLEHIQFLDRKSLLSTSAAAHDDRCNDSSCHEWRGGFNTGDKVSDLKYWLDSSVSSNNYTSILDFGASSWNDISANVSLSKVSKKDDSQVRAYVSYYSQFWDGQWEPYYTDSKGKLSFDSNNFEDWSVGNIRLHLQQIGTSSSSFKKKVAVHEFAHSLSLAHNNDDVSVMKPGDLSFNVPQKADKTHLKNRWK